MRPPCGSILPSVQTAIGRGITIYNTAEVIASLTDQELAGNALEPFNGRVVFSTNIGYKQQAQTVRVNLLPLVRNWKPAPRSAALRGCTFQEVRSQQTFLAPSLQSSFEAPSGFRPKAALAQWLD